MYGENPGYIWQLIVFPWTGVNPPRDMHAMLLMVLGLLYPMSRGMTVAPIPVKYILISDLGLEVLSEIGLANGIVKSSLRIDVVSFSLGKVTKVIPVIGIESNLRTSVQV